MADAYSRLSSGDKIGVFVMQHGPGAENAFGGIAQAFGESVPILVMPMGYARKLAHVQPNFSSVLTHEACHQVGRADHVGGRDPRISCGAPSPHFAMTAAGPSLSRYRRTCLPRSSGASSITSQWPRIGSGPDPEAIEDVAKRLASAQRLVIYAGQGVHYAKAWSELKTLAELLAAPVCTSLQGKSAFPEDHPLALGAGGNAVPKPVHQYLQDADLIFGIGCSFTTSNFAVSMPEGKAIIHATLDPADLNKNVEAEAALLGDARLILKALISAIEPVVAKAPRKIEPVGAAIDAVRKPWLEQWRTKLTSDQTPLTPYRVIGDLAKTVDPENVIITHDAGSPRDQISPFWVSTRPLSYLGWGKTTQLGYGPGSRHGGEARLPGKALHQCLGGCRHRVHGHGFRDGGARKDPDPLHPLQ